MIVTTGTGGRGTSFVAALYRELGFDPGGVWNTAVDAGLEHPEVVRVNRQMIEDLVIWRRALSRRMLAHRLLGGFDEPNDPALGLRFIRAALRWVPNRLATAFGAWSVRIREEWQQEPERFRWDRVDVLAARYGQTLRE